MTNPERTARLLEAIGRYADALHACDVELLDTVFHPASSLFDVDAGGQVVVDPYGDWRADVAARPSPASVDQAQAFEVLAVDWLWAGAAVVRVRLWILDQLFVDHLCLVDTPEGFRVVAKVWHDATDDLPRPPTAA